MSKENTYECCMTSTYLASIDDANAVINSWMSEAESKDEWLGDTGLI